jgi:hypothetical protein
MPFHNLLEAGIEPWFAIVLSLDLEQDELCWMRLQEVQTVLQDIPFGRVHVLRVDPTIFVKVELTPILLVMDGEISLASGHRAARVLGVNQTTEPHIEVADSDLQLFCNVQIVRPMVARRGRDIRGPAVVSTGNVELVDCRRVTKGGHPIESNTSHGCWLLP